MCYLTEKREWIINNKKHKKYDLRMFMNIMSFLFRESIVFGIQFHLNRKVLEEDTAIMLFLAAVI